MISLGNTQMGLGLTVRLVDQFSARSAVVSSSMSKMHKQAFAMQASTLTTARNLGLGMALAGGIMTTAFAGMSKSAADFEWVMTGTRAVTQASVKDYEKMSALAIDLSTQFIYSAQEVGSAMEYLGRAGFGVANVNKTITAVTRLGAATDTSIGGKGGAADMMTNMMTAFNMAAKDSGRMADILTYATTRANLDISDLHESMKFMGQAATDLKIPFQEAASMVTVLGNAGLRGGVAGRSLNNMLLYLAKATGKFRTRRQADVLKTLGIHPKALLDAKGNLLPIANILGIFEKRMNQLPSVGKVSSLQALFNIRGARALTPLLRTTQLGLSFSQMLEGMHRSSKGIAQNIADMRMDTVKGQAIILLDTWKAMKIEIGKILQPYVKTFLKNMQSIVGSITKFAKTPIGKPIFILAAAASVAALVLGTMTFALAAIRLGSMAAGVSGVSAANAIATAWGRATSSAVAYNLASRATWVGAGGQMAMKGVKGFVSSSALGTAGAAVGLSRFTGALGGATGMLGRLGAFFTGPWGMLAATVASITAMFVDWHSVWKYLKYTTLQVGNAFQFIWDYVSSGFDLEKASSGFKRRSYNIDYATGVRKADTTFGDYDKMMAAKSRAIDKLLLGSEFRAIDKAQIALNKDQKIREQWQRSAQGLSPGAPTNAVDSMMADPSRIRETSKIIHINLNLDGEPFQKLVLRIMNNSAELVQE